MEGMEYMYELFEALPRCGPGDNESTRRAFNAISKLPKHPFLLDIGCGSGIQTIELAKISNGKIIALDNHQAFLDKLMKTAKDEGLEDSIVPKNISMRDMNFDENTFDIIWSEGRRAPVSPGDCTREQLNFIKLKNVTSITTS